MPDEPVPPGPVDVPVESGDHDQIQRLLNGDEAAFTALVEKYHDTMLRVARTWIRTPTVAEEVVQETWVAVLHGLARFEGRSSLKTWIFRILANRSKTRAKRDGRTVPMSALGSLDEDGGPAVHPDRFAEGGMWSQPPISWRVSPEQLVVDTEARALIEQAIETLPERQRMVITLRDLRGWTSAEVCNVLEISGTNQRVLLHRARAKVREALEQYLDGEP